MTSQRAAEYLAKGIAVRRYIEPRKSHDIAGLADDMLKQKPRGVDTTLWLEFTERIRALNGHALPDNQAVYHVTAPTEETIKRACVRTGRTLTLFADEIASALTTPEDPAVMGLSPKSLGDKDYRERLKFHAMGQQADLHRLGMVGREVFSMPNREKGPRDPDRDVGGVMTLPRHLELIKRVFDIYSLENDRERKGYEETGR